MDKKKILQDPVACYQSMVQTPSAHTLQTLEHLHKQYLSIHECHKHLLKRKKKLSRRIGETRRDGKSIQALLDEMKHCSAELKQQHTLLTEARNTIIEHFDGTHLIKTDLPDILHEPQRYPAAITPPSAVDIQLHQCNNEQWNDFVNTHPSASIYHRIEWKTLIYNVFGHTPYYYTARDGHGRICGILPLIRLKSRLFGDFMTSMPYFNYGGALAITPDIENQLIMAANNHAAELGVSHVEYRDDISRAGMPSRTDKVNMILPLPDNSTRLWQGFGAKLRSQIKRAQREPHQVIIGSHDCLHDFYTVFARNMRDLGTPVYSRRFFRQILHIFPEQSRIVVIRHAQQPVAAAFLLGYRDRMEIPWASTIRDVNHLSINMLLYWEVLKLASDSDYRFFDFGRSSKHAGTYRFKLQWGAQPKACYWHYWLAEGESLPKLTPDNPKYALAIRLWQRLPVCVSKALGPSIVRNLP